MTGIPIKGKSLGMAIQAYTVAIKRGAKRLDFLGEYLDALYADCKILGIRADVLIAQADLETGSFQSDYWTRDGNPAGIAAFDDGSNWGLTFTPQKAARGHCTHMCVYLGITDLPEGWKATDARWQAAVDAGYLASVTTTDDLGNGRWATDPLYSQKLISRHAAYGFTATTPETPTQETTMAGFKAYTFVGLSKPVYLPDDIMVEITIIPSGNRNVRSNTTRSASVVTTITRHETANFNRGANADMHYRYLMSNPSPAAGYNCVSDDRKIIHLTPYNEDTWAAGTYSGNHTSDHHELCVNSDINHTKARRIAAALDAAVIHARGLTVSKALEQHNYWTGKNCPMLLRQGGLWPSYVNMVQDFYNQIVSHVKGGTPSPIATFRKNDTVTSIDALNFRQGWGTSAKLLGTLPVETELTIKDGPKDADGYTWYDVAGSFGSGWVAADWLVESAPSKPVPEQPSAGWPYPKPIVPPFWEELSGDGVTHVFSAGTLWLKSNDLYRVKTETKRLRVVGSPESIGPNLKVGDEFRDAAKGQGADGKAYVITDGLTRVNLSDLEFVTDD